MGKKGFGRKHIIWAGVLALCIGFIFQGWMLYAAETSEFETFNRSGFTFERKEPATEGEAGTVVLTGVVKPRKYMEIPGLVMDYEEHIYRVTEIGKMAFAHQGQMKQIDFPDTLEKIGSMAFYQCDSLKKLVIPANLKEMASEAFSGCDSLKEIEIDPQNREFQVVDQNLYSRDGKVLYMVLHTGFSYCIPSGVEKVAGGAFVSCPVLERLVIPEGVKTLGVQGAAGTCPKLSGIYFMGRIPHTTSWMGKDGTIEHRRLLLDKRPNLKIVYYKGEKAENAGKLLNLIEGKGLKSHLQAYNPEEKKAFLTFDDGPSACTGKVLEVLDRYGVKATFFVVKSEDPKVIARYKEIIARGHTLAMHSCTHEYNQIYASAESFSKDVEGLSDYLYQVTGIRPSFYRFPGGSSSSYAGRILPKAKKKLNQMGVSYFDWNVSSQDAESPVPSVSVIASRVTGGMGSQNPAVILMHDSSIHQSSVDALPQIIENLKRRGYHLDAIDATTGLVQHR